jgi:hypothetical protein
MVTCVYGNLSDVRVGTLFEVSQNMRLSPTFLVRVRLGKNDHTRCVAVQEIAPSDWANLTLGKKSCCGDRAEPLLHDSAVVMGPAKEALPTPATAE